MFCIWVIMKEGLDVLYMSNHEEEGRGCIWVIMKKEGWMYMSNHEEGGMDVLYMSNHEEEGRDVYE